MNLEHEGKKIPIPDLTEWILKYNLLYTYRPVIIYSKDFVLSAVKGITRDNTSCYPLSVETHEELYADGWRYCITLANHDTEKDKKEGIPGATILHEILHLFLDFHGLSLDWRPECAVTGNRPHREFEEEIDREAIRLAREQKGLLKVIKEFYNMGENNPFGI